MRRNAEPLNPHDWTHLRSLEGELLPKELHRTYIHIHLYTCWAYLAEDRREGLDISCYILPLAIRDMTFEFHA